MPKIPLSDFTNSGLSSVQAIESFHKKIDSLPLVPLSYKAKMKQFSRLQICCDGIGCNQTSKVNKVPENGVWPKTGGWEHQNEIDLCPECVENGMKDLCIKENIQPRGH